LIALLAEPQKLGIAKEIAAFESENMHMERTKGREYVRSFPDAES